MVTEAVLAREVIFRLLLYGVGNHAGKHLIVGKREEHRLNIGIVDAHVLHAVFLLVATCQLMLLDATFHIVVHPCCHHNAILCATVHRLGINVVFLFIILHKPAFLLKLLEVLHRLVIYALCVLIGAGSKVDFGLYDVVERFFVTLCLTACLL